MRSAIHAATMLVALAGPTAVPTSELNPPAVEAPGPGFTEREAASLQAQVPASIPVQPASSAAPGAGSVASGRLRRCISADGSTIFTDRRCQDLQALESSPDGGSYRPGSMVRVRSCAHSRDDLLFGVRSALEAHDVNRLADFYNWTGMSSEEGYRVLERLDRFTERPLVDVQLTTGQRPGQLGLDEYFQDPEMTGDEPDLLGQPPPPPRPRPPPRLLRVDQMRGDKDYSSQVTYFRLLTNAGCWWLQF
jgi:hypothetical protein